MDEKKLFEELNTIKRLLAIQAVGSRGFRDQVKILSEAGLSPTEIANITGKSANVVRVTKSALNRDPRNESTKEKESIGDESNE